MVSRLYLLVVAYVPCGRRPDIDPKNFDIFPFTCGLTRRPSPCAFEHWSHLAHIHIKMTLWDSLTGRRPSASASHPDASPVATLADPAPTTSFTTDLSAPDASSILNSASIPDPSQLHPLANLNQQTLDYLTLEESALSSLPGSQSAIPSRGFSDDLCYGTGVTYITALTIGGAWGLTEGLNRSPPDAPPRLRLNSVLNSVTRRGPFLGTSAGVIALVYNLVNSTIGHYRGKHDSVNSVLAGAVSGMLFKSTRGLRPMLISGGLGASAAGAWAVSLLES